MRVLLIEENPGDIYLISSELKALDPDLDLMVITRGQNALNQLINIEKNPDLDVPELIIIAIKLPGINGLEILEKMQGFRRVTPDSVIIFTENQDSETVQRANELGVSGYFNKSFELGINQDRIRVIYEIARERNNYRSTGTRN